MLLGAPPVLALLAGANDNLLQPPWTAAHVENLNAYQTAGYFHPFTCGWRDEHRDNPGVLVATANGWHCPVDGCRYVQGWAHGFMAEPPGPIIRPLTEPELSMARMREIAARPRPCLLHMDIHSLSDDCHIRFREWLAEHKLLDSRPAREAYALEVERRILDRLIREHAPSTTRRLNPALSK